MPLRLAALLMVLGICVPAAVVSQDWHDGQLSLTLDDGAVQIEWLSQLSFRISRSWGIPGAIVPAISHDAVSADYSEPQGDPHMRTRFLTVDVDHSSVALRIRNGDTAVARLELTQDARGVQLRVTPMDKVFGLMAGAAPSLNLHQQHLERENGFLITSNGYGIFVRSPGLGQFDLPTGTIRFPATRELDFIFYYGPAPKEILDQHMIVTGQTEITKEVLPLLTQQRLPKEATSVATAPIQDWPGLAALVRALLHASLSGVLYPALDVSVADGALAAVKERFAELATLFPILYSSTGTGTNAFDPAIRKSFEPYFITYLREAHDRGYPLIRPLPLQFARDAGSERQSDVFMLGDEFLLAPVLAPGEKKRLDLPRGLWTDLNTNAEYRGNQTIEVNAPPGQMPMFTRNGALFPLEAAGRMELHYFPSLGGEFFLWEPEAGDNSQFHAAPAGDYVRVEIETKVRRTYEWVLHHTKAASEVAEDSMPYARVDNRSELLPGTWWHDAERNDLHLMLLAEIDSDRIVNISF